jgi:endonuclease/exonuclease/phosphatase family metal-dependent hydrolase
VNIHKGVTAFTGRQMLLDLREAIRAAAADVVMLQEVTGGTHGAALQGQAEFLADQAWPAHAYRRNAVVRNIDQGNALLSRWPIVQVLHHDVSVAGHEPRGLLHCVLQLPSTLLHAVCVHLGLREAHRRHQLQRLREVVQGLPANEPVVVAGDFNDWRSRADPLLVPAGLQNVHASAFGRNEKTFPSQLPLLPLDRVYVKGVVAHRPLPLPRRPWSRLSDHAPLGARIDLV